ncbi:hypothetical protein [Nostoc sp. CMAA1605]|uniref:hypothetical protein n=1 Tax=Nostoc sp. CMAA1605 TaxID=2055159 RepID=UPI001F220573|nr:hypothetical protein [Nostoc sp. CMAA1605]MCF4968678.1 hypothetical protein [Nostoc sp. CMAA1605]
MPHIEIKTRKLIDSTLAQKMVDKGTIVSILTTGKITKPAKDLFDHAGIAWAENIPEREFMEIEAQEEG